MVHEVEVGKNVRLSYSKIKEVLDMPNLIEVQKDSYKWFLEEGLKEIFHDISPITDHAGKLVLEFFDYRLDYNSKYSVEECKERDTKYAAPLRVSVRLINTETGEIKEQEIFMGDFPLMTEQGTFVINGAERVIVSQLVRSPGIYYEFERDKTGKPLYSSTVIPYRGAWLEYETDSNDVFSVRIDRTRKLPVTVLLRAMGLGSNAEILDVFGEDIRLLATFEKDTTESREEGLLEIYKRLRPGEPLNVENAESLIMNMFFDPRRYDLAKVGRYKFNKKLAISARIKGRTLAEPVADPRTGEIIANEGDAISADLAMQIERAGVNQVELLVEGKKVRVFSNNMVYLDEYVDFEVEDFPVKKVRKAIIEEILENAETEDEIKEQLWARIDELAPKHIIIDDMFASVNYCLNLANGIGTVDDIDHLGNRRVRCVGELLQNQFRIGLARMERTVRERMSTQELEIITPTSLINIRPIIATINEFFGSSQLSQFMDQNNPLAELRHKRRISALGPGGLSRERAGFEVRDIHYSHYGRMCPIETPEGPNIGLITSLATFAKINQYGFIEAPYRKVDKETGRVTDEIVYMTADTEDEFVIAQANEPLDEEGRFIDKKVSARYRDEILEVPGSRIDYMDISPRQLVSVVTACIPFLENDDANRALMGSNMQCQAVPLLTTDSPIVGTGIEHKIAKDSGSAVLTKEDGVVEKVAADQIVIKGDSGIRHTHKLIKFARSNQSCCINYRPIVKEGERVKRNDIIADGPAMDNGELALGKNILIGFMTWEGYNYEDAVLISEELVKNDVFTSIHVEEYECEARDTKLGPEEITRDIPNVSEDTLKDLDEQGIIRIGAEVHAGDILVGKVTPKGETELTAEERLLRAIFGEKAREVRDTSLKVPHGEYGIILDAKVFTRENGDELSPGVNQCVRVYIAQKRKISVGDKMAGRHGNKGVVSRILPVEDMPFLPNGRPLDIVLNPLGVPSRMNIGQVLEIHLGLAARALGFKIETPVFNGADENDIMDTLELANDYVNTSWEEFSAKWKDTLDEKVYNYLDENKAYREEWKGVPISRTGKVQLRDGRTGEEFDSPVTIGFMHYLKLHHLVDDKIHARSTGPYALVTQQPLGGKAQFGGQRFGEMEVWALEAYGAAYTLQEILTFKSDDVTGRVKAYEAIIKGENISEPGIPESFKVLLKELQSLALDVRVLRDDQTEVELGETVDYGDDDFNSIMQGDGGFRFDTEESLGDYVHKQQTVNSDGEFVDVEDEGSADDDTEEFYGEDSDNE